MSKVFSRRTLQEKKYEYDTGQREDRLYTRCHVKDKACSVIIKGESLTNVVSDIVVEKLGLPLMYHAEQTYHKSSRVSIGEKVMVPIRLGTYEEKVLCVVLPLQSTHILLGEKWQVDHKVKFDKFCNKYSLMFGQKKVGLVPLPPQEVCKDQEYVRHQREERRQMKAGAQVAKDYEVKNNKELQKSVVEVNEQSQEDKEEEEEEEEEEESENLSTNIPYTESISTPEVQSSVLILAPATILPIPIYVVTVLISTLMEPTKTPPPYVVPNFVYLKARVRAMKWKDRSNKEEWFREMPKLFQEEWSRKLPKWFKFRTKWYKFRPLMSCILNLHVRGSKQDKLLSWIMKKYFGRD